MTEESVASSSAVTVTNSNTATATTTTATTATTARRRNSDDYQALSSLGEGAYSIVYRVLDLLDQQQYAMKVLNKAFLQRRQVTHTAMNEKHALQRCQHPNIVALHHTFQDAEALYFILELAPGGDMRERLKQCGRFTLQQAQFWMGELVSCIFYLHHTAGVAHRDIKPENLLFSDSRHLKLTDFGSCKILQLAAESDTHADATSNGNGGGPKKRSFVGSAQYVSPELLCDELGLPGIGVDWWACGCVLHEMLFGCTPHQGSTEYLIFQSILRDDPAQLLRTRGGEPVAAADPHASLFDPALSLIQALMQRDPQSRLGVRKEDWALFTQHSFFQGLDLDRINELTPPEFAVENDKSTNGGAMSSKRGSAIAEDSLIGFGRVHLDSVVAALPNRVEREADHVVQDNDNEAWREGTVTAVSNASETEAVPSSIMHHLKVDERVLICTACRCERLSAHLACCLRGQSVAEIGHLAYTSAARLLFVSGGGAVHAFPFDGECRVLPVDDTQLVLSRKRQMWRVLLLSDRPLLMRQWSEALQPQ